MMCAVKTSDTALPGTGKDRLLPTGTKATHCIVLHRRDTLQQLGCDDERAFCLFLRCDETDDVDS